MLEESTKNWRLCRNVEVMEWSAGAKPTKAQSEGVAGEDVETGV